MADPLAPPLVPSVPVQPQPPNVMSGLGQPPAMTYGMTFSDVGNTGLRAWGGYIREEFLYQLQGRQAATVYREMTDNSPVIGALLFAITATMRKVEWRTNPADDTPAAQEMAEFADSLRFDMLDTWEDTISAGLSMLSYGFAPQEIVYKQRLGRKPGFGGNGKELRPSRFDDGRIGWAKLPIRGQDTITKWFFDPNGEWTGMTQMPWTGPMVDIPAEKLLLFRPSNPKGSPEGRSILRNCWRPYYLGKRLEEQEAILYERMNGIPIMRVPGALMQQAQAGGTEGASALASINEFKKIAINLRIDEQMGIVLPSDTFAGANGPSNVLQYGLELLSPGGTSGKSSGGAGETIKRLENNMLMSALADWISLGHGAVGTQALSTNKTDMFFQGIEGWLNSMAAIYNRQGLERIWDLNGLDPDLMPEYTPDLAQNVDLDILGTYVQKLAQSGMALFPQAELETALLDAAGLPDIASPEAQDALTGDPRTPIAGPLAAAAVAALAPPPEPNSPEDKFGKMLWGSQARRVIRKQGNRFNIRTG